MASETTTPNIGLQVPAFDQANWQVPTNYNWNLLDQIFGGEVEVPALWVAMLTAGNAGDFVLPPSLAEVPAGSVPGTVFTLTKTPLPVSMLSFCVNGLVQRQGAGLDYTVNANIVTLTNPTPSGATVYATYFYSN